MLAEIAIISTDLAELLGSAIALALLFPGLPLWAGVLITACDVFIVLLVGDPLRARPVKMFEWLIAFLVRALFSFPERSIHLSKVFAVLICMVIIVSKVDVTWGQAFFGFVPSKQVFQAGGLYTCRCFELTCSTPY